MKRWLRRIWLTVFHTVSFVWFAVAIIVVFFWIRSYWIADRIGFGSRVIFAGPDSPDGKIWLGETDWESAEGTLSIRVYRQRQDRREDSTTPRQWHSLNVRSRLIEGDWWYYGDESDIEKEDATWSLLGFAYGSNDELPALMVPNDLFVNDKTNHWVLWMPYWAITLAIALWPIIWLLLLARGVRNLKRIARGHCGKCNYNLRSNPTAESCPECGTGTNVER